jgi:hypothetical protein
VPDIARVKILIPIVCLAVLAESGLAFAVPLPSPRPAKAGPARTAQAIKPVEPPLPSACRLRLTEKFAVAPSVPAVEGKNGCGIADAVQLEAVVLADGSRVAVTPPAVIRCTLAEEIVAWVREDVAPSVRALGSAVRGLDNYAAYDCRGRNRVPGARLSEHGKGNALDIRSVRLADRTVVGLTDPEVPKRIREQLRKSACARFHTVLGPGADGYHEHHVHVDLQARRSGYRMCQWEVREPPTTAGTVPLPRPRPART